MRIPLALGVVVVSSLSLMLPEGADAGRRRGGGGGGATQNFHVTPGQQTFASPQADPIAHSPTQDRVYVANTTSNTVDVIDTTLNTVIATIEVGIDPVAIAVRPDGNEVWVSNHISDSVSVIDTMVGSASLHQVVETVQDVDANGVTQFDEPVGIAFASNTKAYVALSSRNDIAVVDATSYTVTNRLHITAQDPRAIAVRGGQLYVAVFESGNTSELSVCPDVAVPPGSPPQCTLDLDDVGEFVITSPNIPGSDARIVRDPDVPDRDLYVFDTTTDLEVSGSPVSGVGTLLYGVTVASDGEVFISQTEARNDVNDQDGENLVELENRMFFNQIARVDCGGASCGSPSVIELEPALPSQPAPGDALATPYGIQISADDSTLVATAAASSRVFTVSTATGNVLDRLDVGAIPRGVAFDTSGATGTAYVLNTLGNSVSVVDVAAGGILSLTTTIPVGSDPTPNEVRLGRIAFNDADASDSGTFSCASCHPDGMNDQLLWRIGGACFFGACSQNDEIRSTMPVRGLDNTLPLHWDGTLGDPFGGTDGSLGGGGSNPADCNPGGPDGDHDCFRHLVDASQSGVMCDQDPSCANGPSGLPGLLTNTERDNMATFLGGVSTSGGFVGGGIPYPPARSRPANDLVSASALAGFSDFFVDKPEGSLPGGGALGADNGDLLDVVTCADMDSGCHALPLGVDDDSVALAGFDVPTMRGMTDRWLQFSIGITNPEEMLEEARGSICVTIQGFELCSPGSDSYGGAGNPFSWDPAVGFEEEVTFAAAFAVFDQVYGSGPVDQFQMFEEASTGFSGAVGRQVTLNNVTTAGCVPSHVCGAVGICDTMARLCELEAADDRGLVNLRGEGTRNGNPQTFSYHAPQYHLGTGTFKRNREQLITEAQNITSPTVRVTLTGHLSTNVGTYPQPLISVATLADGPLGNPDLPGLPDDNPMVLQGIDVRSDAQVFVDGFPLGSLVCTRGVTNGFCDPAPGSQLDNIEISIPVVFLPPDGLHLVQVQNPEGPISNELPFCMGGVGLMSTCR